MNFTKLASLGCVLALAAPAAAAFVDDEFDGSELGAHWTWNPGITEDTSTGTLTVEGGHAVLTAARGSDFSWNIDNQAYIEQDQPTEAEWTVETHLVGFNPVDAGYQHQWNKGGIALQQDNNHWIYVGINSDGNGAEIDWNGQAQFDPTETDGGNKFRDSFVEQNIGFFNDYYLRIRKTIDGYLGEISYDQVNWIPATPLLRNPHSADGTMNGKIRLLTSSGTTQADKNPAPVHFDYVHKTVSTTPVEAYADDEFDSTSAASWTTALGHPMGATSINSGALVIDPKFTSLSGGSDITHGAGTGAESGIVTWQRAPLTSNFSIYTQVGPTVFADASRWQGHGIRLWINQNCWVGIKIHKNGSTPGDAGSQNRVSAMFIDEVTDSHIAETIFTSVDANDPAPGYLRVDRSDSKFRVQYSFDGTNWVSSSFALNGDAEGWITLNMQPNQPILAQLYGFLPAVSGNPGTLANSEFAFIRELDSAVGDWQIY